MLKIYNTLEEVPEALREHYKKSDGRYVPDLSEDHPVLVHNKTLLGEKSTATAKVKELEADIEASKATTLQRGHTQVPRAEAEMLTAYKALGTPDELKVKVTEHGALKESEQKRVREDNLRLVAKALDYDNVDAFVRLPNLPEFEIRKDKDGKDTVIAKVKDGDKIVERAASEFIESSTDIAPFLPALKSKPAGVTVNTTSSTTSPRQSDPFAWAQNFAKDFVEQSQPVADPFKAFQERQSA